MPRKYVRVTTSITMSRAFRALPFWERVDAQIEIRGECHIFTGSKDECGYGRLADSRYGPSKKKLIRLHRAMWEKTHGFIPLDREVCHRCDTPACINPNHLFLGTHGENIADMDRKGRRRTLYGSERSTAKLCEADIPAIRARLANGEGCASISRSYDVSEGLIRHIKNGRNWRHVS